jgi:hypothetical protein
MKNILFIALLFLSVSVFAQGGTSPVAFKTLKFSFGTIKQGKPVTTQFTFTNNSGKPLIIENAEAGCGCTTPDYPKAPILPGKTGEIKVTYNAEATGKFTKNVTVKFANIAEPVTLLIDGEVAAPKQ